MEQDLQKLFKKAVYHPDCRLSDDVCRAILAKRKKLIIRNMFGYLGLGALSLFGSVFFVRDLIVESSKLGFYKYFSLIFSDGGVIATYWREYILTLVDSLPVMSLVLSLALLFVLFISLKKVFSEMRGKLKLA